jgi:hypothetical protein
MSTRTTRTPKRAPRSRKASSKPEPVQAPAPVPALESEPSPQPLPAKPPYARGNPLTHSVTFIDASGTCWLVYVEPAPPAPALWPNAAVIPGRRLRFDSVDRSVMATPFPAGAPFLPERTLQLLLDQAQYPSIGGTPAAPLRAPAVPPPAQPAMVASEAVRPDPAPRRSVVTAPRRSAAAKSLPEPPAEPVRDQLAGVVSARRGVTYQLSRLAQPLALALMVVRDMILPRGRG